MSNRHILRMIVCLILAGLLSSLGKSHWVTVQSNNSPQNPESIDTRITQQMSELDLPGVAIGIVCGDQVVYVQGYGVEMTQDAP